MWSWSSCLCENPLHSIFLLTFHPFVPQFWPAPLENISQTYKRMSCTFPVREMRRFQSFHRQHRISSLPCFCTRDKCPMCKQLWLAELFPQSSNKVGINIIKVIGTKEEEESLLEEWREWWNFHSLCPTHFCMPYMAAVMCSGLLRWFTSLFSKGIILQGGRRGLVGLLYKPVLLLNKSLSCLFSAFHLITLVLISFVCQNMCAFPGYLQHSAS